MRQNWRRTTKRFHHPAFDYRAKNAIWSVIDRTCTTTTQQINLGCLLMCKLFLISFSFFLLQISLWSAQHTQLQLTPLYDSLSQPVLSEEQAVSATDLTSSRGGQEVRFTTETPRPWEAQYCPVKNYLTQNCHYEIIPNDRH